ncbi:MFS transporter [Sulfuracidifex tepidarius]|uniref:Sialic acid transporter n=1 Tax=Sulfuracidifex tepidarius TaxID=1294262 RepID=A0A510E3L7_9CREN|nr:MFS transporter [Sulfuracidifex tepidarius]BBG27076.1 Putative sialic acid transporter [Sulfuracidifex tepidarius]
MNLKDIFKPLDDSNFNAYHARSLLITTLGMFTISYNTTFVSVALPELKKAFGLVAGSPLYVLLGISSFITAIIGALLFGFVSNFKGRKAVYGYEALLLSIGSLLGAFTQNAYELIATQMIFGIGIGGDFVMSPIVLGEFANKKDRGKLLAFAVGVTGPLGSITSATTLLVLPMIGVHGDLVWRLVLALGAIIPGSIVYLRRKVPESPRYLVRIKGDIKQFEQEVKEVAKQTSQQPPADVKTVDKVPVLFYMRKYAKFIAIAGVLWFLDHMVNPGGVFEPALVGKSIGVSNTAIFSLVLTLAASIPGGALSLLLIDRWGRKPLEAMGFTGMAISLVLFAVFKPSLALSNPLTPILGMLFLGGYHFWHNVGPANVSAAGIFNVELTPTKIRGIASGIVVTIDRIGALANSAIFPFLFFNFGLPVAVGVGGALGIIAAIVTLIILPETKMKSLEESSNEDIWFNVENPQ